MSQHHTLRNQSRKQRLIHHGKRVLLWEFQKGFCGCCGEPIVHPRGIPVQLKDKPTIEHVWPISRFPRRRSWGNIILSHWRCNSKKKDRLPTGCELIWLDAVNARYQKYKKEKTNRERREKRAAKRGRKPNDPYHPDLTDEQIMAIFHNPRRRVDSRS